MNKILIALLFTLHVGGLCAADYVDDINKSVEMRSDGHRVVYEMNVARLLPREPFLLPRPGCTNSKRWVSMWCGSCPSIPVAEVSIVPMLLPTSSKLILVMVLLLT